MFPVIYRPQLPNYGDEFAQDLHLFPFSPEPIILIALTPDYSIFNSHYIIITIQKIQYFSGLSFRIAGLLYVIQNRVDFIIQPANLIFYKRYLYLYILPKAKLLSHTLKYTKGFLRLWGHLMFFHFLYSSGIHLAHGLYPASIAVCSSAKNTLY